MKLTKKEAKKIGDFYRDYFCDVILPLCFINGYEVRTTVKPTDDGERVFSVKVNFPYRLIEFFVRERAVDYYRERKFDEMRQSLFHEAFHIILWKYKEYAESRFIEAAILRDLEEDMADQFGIILTNLYKKQKNEK